MLMKNRKKLMPMLVLMLTMSILLLAAPVMASAEEPFEDDEYTENIDGYEYYDGYYDDEYVELPEEYYYPSYAPVFEDGENSFAPDGMGTVINNSSDSDGKEFYTIETPDGNIFYLVIDKQRSVDNVYFLSAVTEEDLLSLAQIEIAPDNAENMVITGNIGVDEPVQNGETPESAETPSVSLSQSNDDMMLYVIIGVAVAGIGGAAYYIKIVKPKKDGTGAYDEDYGEDYGNDDDDDDDGYGNDDDGNGNNENDGDGYVDENSYEDETDVDFDDGAAPVAYDGYSSSSNVQQPRSNGNSPPNQGNRNNRRRRKRRKPNYSG